MTFLHPEFLYLFLLIPILIVINLFFKGKRSLPVTSLFIWEKFYENQKPKRFTFNRLRKDILLLLQILFVLFAVFALSQPTFLKKNRSADRVAFIIDSSISMKYKENGEQYINLAKEQALQLLKNSHKSDRVMIVKADTESKIIHPYSLQTNQLIKAIDGISTTDTIGNLDKAIVKVFSLRETPSKIIVFTGKIPDKIVSESTESDIIKWVSVGKALDNLKILDFDIRKDFSTERNYQTFLRISNDSNKDQLFKIKFYHEDKLFKVSDVVMAPREKKTFLTSIGQIREGLIRIKLEADDDLKVDNEVFALIEPERILSALLVTSGNRFLENVLALHDSVDIELCDTSSFENRINKWDFDVVIYDKVTQDLPVLTDSIFISTNNEEYVDMEKGIVVPELLDFNHGHRFLEGLDLSNLSIQKSNILKVPDWGEILVESEQGVLMFCGERNNKKFVIVGFDLMQSNFPLEISFPLFISRLINWFSNYEHKNWIMTGDPFYYKLTPSSKEDSVLLTYPNGKQIVHKIKDNLIAIADTNNAGIYKLEGDTFQKRFVVNFQTGEASENTLSKKAIQQSEIELPETIPQGLGILFAIFSLCALVFEWYFSVRI